MGERYLGSRRRELKRAGIAAAREARGVLAEAIAVLDAEIVVDPGSRAFAEPLTAAVATLYRAEVGGPDDVRDRLREAALALGRVLEGMHAPGAGDALDRAGPLVARTLAILHPARAELERELAIVRASDVPPARASGVPPSSGPPSSVRPSDGPRSGAPAPAVPPEVSLRETVPEPAAQPPRAERRAARRVAIETAVGAHAASRFLGGRTGDLSTGGLFVATRDPLPVGTLVTIGLVLPDGHRATIDATVTWVRGPHAGDEGMGVKFTRVTDEDARALARHVG